jgi:uncharacterized protein YqhQ
MTTTAPDGKLQLGGMALSNGLLFHGPTQWAAAIRMGDDEIKTASGPRVRLTSLNRRTGLRGLAYLAESIALLPAVKLALPEARFSFENAEVLKASLISSGTAALIRRRLSNFAGDLIATGIALAPAAMALKAGEVAQYHGAEHKLIAAYEQGVTDVSYASKEHDRCGSHLVLPVVLTAVSGDAVIRTPSFKNIKSGLFKAAAAFGAAAAATEFFIWSERHPNSWVYRLLHGPGNMLQSTVGTKEPTEQQLEVGKAALDALLKAEESSGSQA